MTVSHRPFRSTLLPLCLGLILLPGWADSSLAQRRQAPTATRSRTTAQPRTNTSKEGVLAVKRGQAASTVKPARELSRPTLKITGESGEPSGVTARYDARGGEIRVSATRQATLGKAELLVEERGRTVQTIPLAVVDTPAITTRFLRTQQSSTRAARSKYSSGGWQSTRVTKEDPRVAALEPKTPRSLKGEMLRQIRSNSFGANEVDKLERLAVSSDDADIRRAAIEALARSPASVAQQRLAAIAERTNNQADRSHIVASMRPLSATDPAFANLATAASKSSVSADARNAAAAQLAAATLATVQTARRPPRSIASKVPGTLRATYNTTYQDLFRREREEHIHGGPVQVNPNLRVIDGLLSGQEIQPGDYVALKANPGGEPTKPSTSQLNNPGTYRQIFFVPTGFTSDQRDEFLEAFARYVKEMGDYDDIFTGRHSDKIIYIAQWLPGPALPPVDAETSDANFAAVLYTHPFRTSRGLTLIADQLADTVDAFRSKLSKFQPLCVMVIYNTEEPITPNAMLPTHMINVLEDHTVKEYGVGRVKTATGSRTVAHEMGHAAMNWLDEYHESYLDDVSITTLDVLTPALLANGSWGSFTEAFAAATGMFNMRISECFVDTGADNVSTSEFPDLVGNSGEHYSAEGGNFFGKGVFHQPPADKPSAMMKAYSNHSAANDRILAQVFEGSGPGRPNNRIRIAGPLGDWAIQMGNAIPVLMHDADKHHRWHPTKKYQIQVKYDELTYETVPVLDFNGNPMYWPNGEPMTVVVPTTEERQYTKDVTPETRYIDISQSLLTGMADVLLMLLEGAGVDSVPVGPDKVFQLAGRSGSELSSSTLPTLLWPVPYQEAEIEAPLPLTVYSWRFRAFNGANWSGWTGWSDVKRAF